MNKLRVAVIGCGKQAPKHISGLRKTQEVELVLADSCADFAQNLAVEEGISWVPDVDSVFADKTIAAVDICTPTPTHAGLIDKALESGKDFFCEKPLCESLAQAREINEKMQTTGRVGMVGYTYRFAPVFELGRRLIVGEKENGSSPVLGRLITGLFRIGGRGSHQIWKHRKESGGGAINEMLVHMLDLAIWYFGPIKRCNTLVSELLRPQRDIQGEDIVANAEDFVLLQLETANCIKVICQADMVTPAFTQYIEIQGENGTFMASIQPEMPSFLFCTKEAGGYPAGRTTFNFGPVNLFESQMSEFINCVRSRIEPRRCSIKDSIYLLEALDAIRKGAI